MKRFVLIAGVLALTLGAAAQESGWPVEQRCIGEFNYPSIPPSRWDFEGTIISRSDDGVRAIQVVAPQQYFVALSAADSFPEAGAFSPDGRWFVYPALDGLRSVLTVMPANGSGDTTQIPWDFERTALPQPYWNTSAVIHVRQDDGQWAAVDHAENDAVTRIDPPLRPERGSAVPETGAVATSPDGSYVAYVGVDALGRGGSLRYADLENETIYDLCYALPLSDDTTMAWSPDGATLAFTVDGFPVLLNVETVSNQVLRYKTGTIMAWLPPPRIFKDGRG